MRLSYLTGPELAEYILWHSMCCCTRYLVLLDHMISTLIIRAVVLTEAGVLANIYMISKFLAYENENCCDRWCPSTKTCSFNMKDNCHYQNSVIVVMVEHCHNLNGFVKENTLTKHQLLLNNTIQDVRLHSLNGMYPKLSQERNSSIRAP